MCFMLKRTFISGKSCSMRLFLKPVQFLTGWFEMINLRILIG